MAKRQAKKNISNDKVTMYKITKKITHEEQSIIVDLIQSHHSELFTGQQYEREEAWINICEKYNLHQTPGPRKMEELKYIFENLSKAAKIENSVDKVGRYKTGGGTYTKSMTSISEQILGVIGERTEPLINTYDDDAGYTITDQKSAKYKEHKHDYKSIENEPVTHFYDNIEELDVTIDDLGYTDGNRFNWDLSTVDAETITNDTTDISPKLMTNNATTNAANKSYNSHTSITPFKDTNTKNRSSQKKLCDDLQELTQNKIKKVQDKRHISSELDDIKIKKSKIELQSAEVALQILQTELLTKKIEMESKKKTNASPRRNIKLTKT